MVACSRGLSSRGGECALCWQARLQTTEGVALVDIILWSCLSGILGLAGGAFTCYVMVRRHDRRSLVSSQNRATEIVAHAAKESVNLRKEAELKAKDEVFQRREEFSRELEQT